MVVLGSWPYHHTLTLDQISRQLGAKCYYFVDDDKIVSGTQADRLEQQGYIVDDTLFTIMSEDMNSYMHNFKGQVFPPIIPDRLQKILAANENKQLTSTMDRVKSSALVLIVNGQDKDVMDDIGATWNTSLSTWVLDITSLKQLRERKKKAHNGKIMCEPYFDTMVKIWGDVSKHTTVLKEAGGRYDEAEDVWYVHLNNVDKVSHILSR